MSYTADKIQKQVKSNKNDKYTVEDMVKVNDSIGIIAEKRENDVLVEFGLTTQVFEYADIELIDC